MRVTKIIILISLIIFAVLIIPNVLADSATPVTYKSFTSFPGIGQISSLCELTKALWFIGYAILFISVIGMYMYGGFLYTSSGVNASGVNQAKGIFTNSTIGLVLGLSVYVILNTLNPGLLTTQCTITPVPNAPTGSGASSSTVASGIFTPTGQIGVDIYNAALSLEGASSVGCGSACGNGNLACQYMVNKVLERSGLSPLDGLSTSSAEDELKAGRGTALTQTSTQPGDIVYAVGDHVGICLNTGCSEILSNSSSKAKFSWRSGANFDGSYGATPITYYRVNN